MNKNDYTNRIQKCCVCEISFIPYANDKRIKCCSNECSQLYNQSYQIFNRSGIKFNEIPDQILQVSINYFKLLKTIKDENPCRELECNE